MKNKFLPLALVAFVGIMAAFAFNRSEWRVAEVEDGVEYLESAQAAASSGAVYKAWTKDTITNAANDTLTLGYILSSPYQYAFQIRMTNISGTRAVKFYLEQTAATGSTRYMKVDSAITSGTTVNDYLMKGQNVWGNKYRIIVDGSGTQSTAYQVDGLLKKTN